MSEEQLRDTLAQMVRVGFVSARQPEKMRVRVELRDTVTSSLVTDWLPVLCPRACGDLAYDLPDVGDQVLCLFLGYGLEQGFVLGAMYGKAAPPVSSGDIWQRRFQDGTVLEYEVCSVGFCDVEETSLPIYCNLEDEAFRYLIEDAIARNQVDGLEQLSAGDQILTLATCTEKETERLVIVAKQIYDTMIATEEDAHS